MTKKERNLLVVVAILLMLVLFWFLLYKPMTTKISNKQIELDGLNVQLDQLRGLYLKKENYEEEILRMKAYNAEIEAMFPGDLTQEMVIYGMIQLENEIESLMIPGYTMSPLVVLASDGEFKEEGSETILFKENFVELSTQLALETTYADLKKMLAFIRDYDTKLSIKDLQITSDLDTGIIQSGFNLNYYGLISLDTPYEPKDFFGPFEPKEDSIFSPYEGYGVSFDTGETVSVKEVEDFNISLASIYADRTTVVMYDNKDAVGDTYIYADNTGNEPIEFVFENEGATYYYRYKTSKSQYPTNYSSKVQFIPGEVIDIKCYVETRIDEKDLSGANVTIKNNTDLPVIVRVIRDDISNPRFNLVLKTGDVEVFNSDN